MSRRILCLCPASPRQQEAGHASRSRRHRTFDKVSLGLLKPGHNLSSRIFLSLCMVITHPHKKFYRSGRFLRICDAHLLPALLQPGVGFQYFLHPAKHDIGFHLLGGDIHAPFTTANPAPPQHPSKRQGVIPAGMGGVDLNGSVPQDA